MATFEGVCIGGTRDGKRLNFSRPFVSLPEEEEINISMMFANSGILSKQRTETYVHMLWHGENETFGIWRLSSLSIDDALKMIFKFYETGPE